MKVKEFFERYSIFQERRAFIIELVDAAMTNAGLFLCISSPGTIIYDHGGSELRRRYRIDAERDRYKYQGTFI